MSLNRGRHHQIHKRIAIPGNEKGPEENAQMREPLRIATFLAPNMRPVYEYISTTIGAELGSATELTTGVSFDQFAAGEIDVGFICGLPYVELIRQQPAPVELLAAPVLAGARYRGRPVYFSDVIVRHDSSAQ